jgi:DNA repair protein RadC
MARIKGLKISSPNKAAEALVSLTTKKVEYFVVLTLDGSHSVIRKHVITKGLVNRTLVHPREVFHAAVKDLAVAIIIAHNHPSGSLEPSTQDEEITRKMIQAGEVMGIPVLDHMIISRKGYYSFLEHNRLH